MVSPQMQFRKGLALHQAGRTDEAADIYEAVLREDSSHAGAWNLLGAILKDRGDSWAALRHMERSLSLCDTKGVYWNNYGAVLKELGRLGEAKRAFERALAIRSEYPDALANLGLMQLEMGDLSGAEQSLLTAIGLDPHHIDALRHLAVVRSERGHHDEALRMIRETIRLEPERAELHQIHANILIAMQRSDEALNCFHRALELAPESVETQLAFGLLCSDLDDTSKARHAFERAAQLRPDRPMWRLRHLTLCPVVFQSSKMIEEYWIDLETELDRALADPPPFDWRHALRDGFGPSFQLSHHGVCSRQVKEKFARLFEAAFPRKRPPRKKRGKLRVGFLCTHGHEGGFVRGFGGIMERLNPQQFDIVALVSSKILPFCRQAVRSDAVTWIGFPHHLERAGTLIRQAECDVLMHWQAGTDRLNYFLPFLPLAPVQAIGFGSHGTTGIGNIDYFVSSKLFERGEEAAEDYTEELVCFDNTTAWQRREPPAEPATRDDFGLPTAGAIYLCPQRTPKFQPSFRHLIGRILEEDPTGQVVILGGRRGPPVEALRRIFQSTINAGVFERIKILPSQNIREYRRLIGISDLVLDSPCYSASLTGYDAFSQNTPIVTWPGKYMVQRYASGLYERMGIRDLVASNEDHYVELAVRLGRQPDFRQEMCERIRERSDVLFEDEQVVREYERFFLEAMDD